jgi:phosphohistidine swiveling domain-containing protein
VHDTPEALAQRFAEMQRLTMELGSTALADWRATFEPDVLARAAAIMTYDYAGHSTAEVAQFVATFYNELVDVWDIHMRVNIPPMNAVFGLEAFLGEVLGDESAHESRLLLQGYDNKSVALGRALWDLSRWANSVEGMAAAVLDARVRDGKVEIEHPQAAEFQQRLHAFLDDFGWRSDVFGEFGHRSWREDPSTPLTQLKSYIRKPDSEDPFLGHARQAAEREQLVEALAAKLPPELQPQFRGMLQLAQQYIPIAEDHNFTIDQKFTVVVREGMQELGRKLVADGALADSEDVFYLTLDDIRAIGDGGATDGLRDAVLERRRDFVRNSSVTPPPMLGTPPPADMPVDPLVTKFFGFGIVPSDDARVVVGYPASAGVVTGEAKVIMSLDEAGKLGPGDILVCRMTMPAWTPLFGVAGGVVADAGGPLSHCAIVAREYQIPCVAGTQIGTSVIRDGMRIRVDGSTGRVQILD